MLSRRLSALLIVLASAPLSIYGGSLTTSASATLVKESAQAGSAPSNFNPVSISFISSDVGWSIGTSLCAAHRFCFELAKTVDGGSAWTLRPLPSSLLNSVEEDDVSYLTDVFGHTYVHVHFANEKDGWIYGLLRTPTSSVRAPQYRGELWSTHNGGASWRNVKIPGLTAADELFDLEIANGVAQLLYEVGDDFFQIASSTVESDNWHVTNTTRLHAPAGGDDPTGAIGLQGKTGWVVAGNGRGASASARLVNGSWIPWTAPCARVGNSYAVPALYGTMNLTVLCQVGGIGSNVTSADPPGAKIDSLWLYRSTDGGRTFKAGPEQSVAPSYSYTTIATPASNTILIGRDAGDGVVGQHNLSLSTDGGRHWTRVYRGVIGSLQFVSPRIGFAVVHLSIHPNMALNLQIKSVDTGRHWSKVKF